MHVIDLHLLQTKKASLKLAFAWFTFNSISLYLQPIMRIGLLMGDEDLNFASGQI